MYEQFIIVKHDASFLVTHNTDTLTIEPLQPGRLHPSICKYVAMSQRSIVEFYLAEQKWKGRSGSLMTFFSEKGWQIEKVIYNVTANC